MLTLRLMRYSQYVIYYMLHINPSSQHIYDACMVRFPEHYIYSRDIYMHDRCTPQLCTFIYWQCNCFGNTYSFHKQMHWAPRFSSPSTVRASNNNAISYWISSFLGWKNEIKKPLTMINSRNNRFRPTQLRVVMDHGPNIAFHNSFESLVNFNSEINRNRA